jgi:hypothetical protein
MKGDPNSQQDLIGEASFDLAKYGKTTSITERLPLKDMDDDSYIEIAVKTK